MKIITAFDSYKNCLDAESVCNAFARGWLSCRPDDEIISLPLSDGGEGFTAAALRNLNAVKYTFTVTGPLGGKVNASCAVTGKTAYTEMAQSSGLELITAGKLDALHASTYGFGELLRAIAAIPGVEEIVCGIGGSATSDGGMGCAQALGWRFFDAGGMEIPQGAGAAECLKVQKMIPPEELPSVSFRTACDVANPLTGQDGAAGVYSPQKGASPEMVEVIEAALCNWSTLWQDAGDVPGDGAAGGLGFFLRKGLSAAMRPGAETALELAGFSRHAATAQLVITGEGASDKQTLCGKLPFAVAGAARSAGLPCILLSGKVSDAVELLEYFDAVWSIANGPCTVPEAIAGAADNLFIAGANLARLTKQNFTNH